GPQPLQSTLNTALQAWVASPAACEGPRTWRTYLSRARGSPGSRGAAPADVALPKNDAPTLDPARDAALGKGPACRPRAATRWSTSTATSTSRPTSGSTTST